MHNELCMKNYYMWPRQIKWLITAFLLGCEVKSLFSIHSFGRTMDSNLWGPIQLDGKVFERQFAENKWRFPQTGNIAMHLQALPDPKRTGKYCSFSLQTGRAREQLFWLIIRDRKQCMVSNGSMQEIEWMKELYKETLESCKVSSFFSTLKQISH